MHFVALPTPYIFGASPEEMSKMDCIGPSNVWKSSNSNVQVGFLEFQGQKPI